MSWPKQGVYFFFEQGEARSDSVTGRRVVRVGTHGLTTGAQTTLWKRLSQHRGVEKTGGGNHRGSVFRLLVGAAILAQDSSLSCDTWGVGSTAPRATRDAEHPLEVRVSGVLRQMSISWLGVEDEPGPRSLRGYVERNAISLLSNYRSPPLEPPSQEWLGLSCPRERIRKSGLWNSNHVDEPYDPLFLDTMDELIT